MNKSKLLKFGGRSLANGKGINQVLDIIASEYANNENLTVVVSARGNATDELADLLELAASGKDFQIKFNRFKQYQSSPVPQLDLSDEFDRIEKILTGIRLINDYSNRVGDLLLSYGEIICIKSVSELLRLRNIPALACDSRAFIKTDTTFGNANMLEQLSEKKSSEYFSTIGENLIPIVSGFIGSNDKGETTTLGRNGSNLTASAIAKYLDVSAVESYTHVDGIFTADPNEVDDAGIIHSLSYQEANDLASFGASILHSKTIAPLEKANIPLHIKNTFAPEKYGTLINGQALKKGIKSIAVKKDLCIINIEGNGLLGKTGIDARIFTVMHREKISIGLISQGSTERGIGFVIPKKFSDHAVLSLKKEFENELTKNIIHSIAAVNNIAAITVVGVNLSTFNSAYDLLIKNNINILLISNNIRGNNISLVTKSDDVEKTVNIIHSQIFGYSKKINIAVLGKGNVGGCLINQILENHDQILKRKETQLNIFAIAGITNVLFNKKGIKKNWKELYKHSDHNRNAVEQIISYAQKHHLENLVVIDNTASNQLTDQYEQLIMNGFDIISSNKIANTKDYSHYVKLRKQLKKFNREYLYETNVGAGLPLIDTIKLLHNSGENITRIRGIFSGSLSYIFNTFSEIDEPFSKILGKAIRAGYTEPDPREDLFGSDVARKLLILARELELENEFDEIRIENLIPEKLREIDPDEFLQNLHELDVDYNQRKEEQKPGHVLRYVGDLYGDLQQTKANLKVELLSVPKNSSLGQVKGSDSLFEIYTDSYGDQPIVIQGAGAGAQVTARGVFGDLLRIAERR